MGTGGRVSGMEAMVAQIKLRETMKYLPELVLMSQRLLWVAEDVRRSGGTAEKEKPTTGGTEGEEKIVLVVKSGRGRTNVQEIPKDNTDGAKGQLRRPGESVRLRTHPSETDARGHDRETESDIGRGARLHIINQERCGDGDPEVGIGSVTTIVSEGIQNDRNYPIATSENGDIGVGRLTGKLAKIDDNNK